MAKKLSSKDAAGGRRIKIGRDEVSHLNISHYLVLTEIACSFLLPPLVLRGRAGVGASVSFPVELPKKAPTLTLPRNTRGGERMTRWKMR
jgi:hypothetical protein